MSDNQTDAGPGRVQAFEGIVSAYESALLRYVSRLINNHAAAQDVVQETFIRLYRNWAGDLRPAQPLASWLYRVAHNCAVDYVRKEVRRTNLHDRHSCEQPDWAPPDRGAAFRISESAERAAAAMQSLSLRERQLVILKVYEEKSYREISEITGLTETNIGYILHQSMKKMARALREAKGDPGPAGSSSPAAERPLPHGAHSEETPEE